MFYNLRRLQPRRTHSFDLSAAEAMELQSRLRPKVILYDQLPNQIQLIAGVDVAYEPMFNECFAAIAVCDACSFRVKEMATARGLATFGYVPGLFSFRELPAIMMAMSKMKYAPDLIICDGQGIAHPRRFGLASHLGVLYDLPTIGCAKTRLLGEAVEPGARRGDWSELRDQSEVVGAVLRTRDGVNPVYVSQGHRISLQTALDWVLRGACRYRLPEPIREANGAVNRLRAQYWQERGRTEPS
jgi:deoxyribonuclease V